MAGANRFGRLAAVLLVPLATISATACTSLDNTQGPSERVIYQQDAEALLSRAAGLAQVGNFDGLCQVIAAANNNCLTQLDNARRLGQHPGSQPPTVNGAHYYKHDGHPTFVLHIKGTEANGREYTGDFAVIYKDEARLGSLTSVYWTGIQFTPPGPPTAIPSR